MGNRPALCQIVKIISFYELNANHDLGFRIANACKENPRYAMHSEGTLCKRDVPYFSWHACYTTLFTQYDRIKITFKKKQ